MAWFRKSRKEYFAKLKEAGASIDLTSHEIDPSSESESDTSNHDDFRYNVW